MSLGSLLEPNRRIASWNSRKSKCPSPSRLKRRKTSSGLINEADNTWISLSNLVRSGMLEAIWQYNLMSRKDFSQLLFLFEKSFLPSGFKLSYLVYETSWRLQYSYYSPNKQQVDHVQILHLHLINFLIQNQNGFVRSFRINGIRILISWSWNLKFFSLHFSHLYEVDIDTSLVVMIFEKH